MNNEQTATNVTAKKRGRTAVFTDQEYLSAHATATSVGDILDNLKVIGESFEGERKETFNKWISNKTTKQLHLFVSMRSSSLRKKGSLLNNTQFKPGPKKLFNVEPITNEEIEESISIVAE